MDKAGDATGFEPPPQVEKQGINKNKPEKKKNSTELDKAGSQASHGQLGESSDKVHDSGSKLLPISKEKQKTGFLDKLSIDTSAWWNSLRFLYKLIVTCVSAFVSMLVCVLSCKCCCMIRNQSKKHRQKCHNVRKQNPEQHEIPLAHYSIHNSGTMNFACRVSKADELRQFHSMM
jgi:hypothetical protein